MREEDLVTVDINLINDTLADLAVPIDSVQPYPNNPRRGDIEAIRASLRANGQYRPVVAQRSTRYLLAGNNTWQAAKEEGWTELAVQFIHVDDVRARAILLADNKVAEAASYDQESLATILQQVMDTQGIVGTGWSADEIDDYLAQMAAVNVAPYEEFTGDYADAGSNVPSGYGLSDDDDGDVLTSRGVPSMVGQLREVIVMVRADAYDAFQQNVRACMKKYGLGSLTETVQEAVRREAQE